MSNSTELKQNTANNNDLKSSLLNQQQTLTSTNDKEVKPWSNPYWSTVDKNSNEQSIQKTNNSDSSTAKTTDSSLPSDSTKKSWENPYWKDKTPTVPSSAPPQQRPWENPYWKDKTSTTSSTAKSQDKSWENPYWKDKASTTSSTAKSQDKSWENPYWKHKTPTIPSSAPPRDKPWKNPYWKDKASTTSSTAKSQDKSWENPYWKDKTPTVPSSAPPQSKPWENPYWKDKASTTSSTAKPQDKSWENPYWKDKTSAIPSSAPPRDKAWENPYWKDKAPTTSSTAKPQDKSWENPYWKDKTSSCNGTSKQQDKPWENPYWKDKKTSSVIPVSTYETSTKGGKKKIPNDVWTLDNDSPPDHKVSPVPPFYQRIYPPPTSQTSSQYGGSIKNSLNKSQSGKRLLDQSYNHYTDENDDTDALPYTTDGDGVVRYRKLPASTCVSSSKRPSVTGELLKSQNLISTPTKTIPLSPQENNPTISALVSSNVPKPSQHNNESSSSSPSQPNFETFEALNYINRLSNKDGSPLLSVTYGELCDVQKALRAVETRSNNISTIESYQSKSLKQSNSNVTIPHSGYDNPAKIVDSHPQSTENLPPRINSANKFSTPNESLNRFMKNGPAVHI